MSLEADVRLVKHAGGPFRPFLERRPCVSCVTKDLLRAIRITMLVGLWWSAAIGVTLLIKGTVGSRNAAPGEALFPFPFALTAMTNFLSGVGAWVLGAVQCLYRRKKPSPKLCRHEVLKLLSIGLIQGVEIGCNNKSLEFLSMSGRTMLNSMNVLFMMCTAVCWSLERLGALRVVSVLLLTFGGFCQGVGAEDDGASSFDVWHRYLHGVLLLLVSMTLGAQRWALVQFVLQRSSRDSALGQMSKVQLLSWTMPITASVCFVMAVIFEVEALNPQNLLNLSLLASVMGTGAGVATLTFAELSLVHLTSAVAVQVLATIHQIPIVLAGVVFFHEHVHLMSLVGFGICLVGALFYVAARRMDRYMEDKMSDTGANSDFSDFEEEELVVPELLGVAQARSPCVDTLEHGQGSDPFGI